MATIPPFITDMEIDKLIVFRRYRYYFSTAIGQYVWVYRNDHNHEIEMRFSVPKMHLHAPREIRLSEKPETEEDYAREGLHE